MGADREELGLSTLRLLAEDCMLTVLAELSRGPVRTSDIETRAAESRTGRRCVACTPSLTPGSRERSAMGTGVGAQEPAHHRRRTH